jgi:hypothetical protein
MNEIFSGWKIVVVVVVGEDGLMMVTVWCGIESDKEKDLARKSDGK